MLYSNLVEIIVVIKMLCLCINISSLSSYHERHGKSHGNSSVKRCGWFLL